MSERESLENNRDFWIQEARCEKMGAFMSRIIGVGCGISAGSGLLAFAMERKGVAAIVTVVGGAGYLFFDQFSAEEKDNAVEFELKAILAQGQIDQLEE